MTRPLKPGDLALVIDGPARGHLVEVLSHANFDVCGKFCLKCPCNHKKIQGHQITRLTHHDKTTGAPARWLMPIHDPDKTEEYLSELNEPVGEGEVERG